MSGEYGGCSSVVTLFFAKKFLRPKPTGVLEHCRKEETNFWLRIFGAFPSDLSGEGCLCTFLYPKEQIPANYTSGFRELFEATK
jgi:hypothetical protein